jgi:hypothetical protein
MDQISHALSLKVKSMPIKLYISICALNFKKLNKTYTLYRCSLRVYFMYIIGKLRISLYLLELIIVHNF